MLVESEINVCPNSKSDRPKWDKFITLFLLHNSYKKLYIQHNWAKKLKSNIDSEQTR